MTAIIHFVSSRDLWPNKSVETNRRPELPFRRPGFIGRWIRCQCPLLAAVGGLIRWPETE